MPSCCVFCLPELARLQEPLIRNKVYPMSAVQAMRRSTETARHDCTACELLKGAALLLGSHLGLLLLQSRDPRSAYVPRRSQTQNQYQGVTHGHERAHATNIATSDQGCLKMDSPSSSSSSAELRDHNDWLYASVTPRLTSCQASVGNRRIQNNHVPFCPLVVEPPLV
jgi:hypothetical protein